MDGQSVPERSQAEVPDQVEIFLPALVVTALLQQVPPESPALGVRNRGIGALDPGRKCELSLLPLGKASQRLLLLRRGPPPTFRQPRRRVPRPGHAGALRESCVTLRLTCRELVDHTRRIQEADLSQPVVLSAEGHLMDGFHHLAKAYLLGMDEIAAVQFEEPSEPDPIRPLPEWLSRSLQTGN